jgi:glycerol-3-phosphate acyltransferase PlsY
MIAAFALSGYLLGSIPVAWLIAKAISGGDLRNMGSGNVGVTNVALSVCRWAGILTFAAEIGKGMITVVIPRRLGASDLEIYAAVLAAIVGTRWPVWLGFQGGRGNSVGFGALALLSWPSLMIGLAVWVAARLITRTSFWASRICIFCWPIIFGLMERSWLALIFAGLIGFVYFTTHDVKTDDHLIIKEQWPSFLAFLFSPPRNRS